MLEDLKVSAQSNPHENTLLVFTQRLGERWSPNHSENTAFDPLIPSLGESMCHREREKDITRTYLIGD
jgi:hypothetical protein